jgi:SpoIID/LytB domain protein
VSLSRLASEKAASDAEVSRLAIQKAESERAASEKAASEKAAAEKAASEKAASEKAAAEKAAAEKAAAEKAASEKAAADKAASEKAASEAQVKALRASAEADAATAADNAAGAAKDAARAAEAAEEAHIYEQASGEIEYAWNAYQQAVNQQQKAEKAAAEAGTDRAAQYAAAAKQSAKAAEADFGRTEAAALALRDAERNSGTASRSSGSSDSSGSSGSGGSSNRDAGTLTVNANGKKVTMDAAELIARVVQNEVGSTFHEEAIKAQAVAAYTYILHGSQGGKVPSVYTAGSVSDKVRNAVNAVIGEAVTYKGELAFTPYHATSAGATTSSKDVWGGSYPYLVSVDSSIEEKLPTYKATVTMTRDKVEGLISSKLGIEADGDPEDWFEILSEADGGYNGDMAVCGRTKASSGTKITGRLVREHVLGLRSARFDVDYDSGSDRFTFTTYGYGHGVGMSQNGANLYANEGWSYIDILEHYYPGTRVE